MLLGAQTPELSTYVQAAKDAAFGRDSPLSEGQQAVMQRMLPALARVLAVAPPRSSPAEVERLCLQEWIRECADELVRQSAVLSELSNRSHIHVERAVVGADGALALL